jgi:putative nucleotidyltransferase with HDIG domain
MGGRTSDSAQLKWEHTKRVQAETELLVRDLGLPEDFRRFAVAAALLHDVGRFEQFARYQTFDDARSTDHAVLGWTILRDGKHLDWLPAKTRDLLLDAVLFHNRVRLPEISDSRKRAVCQILRDADKLDIWGMVAADYRQHQGIPDRPFYRGLPREAGISAGVRAAVVEGRPVDFLTVKKLNDYVVLQAGMTFDVNFAPTFRRITERDILPVIRSVLPAGDEAVDEIFAIISLYAGRMAQQTPASLSFL